MEKYLLDILSEYGINSEEIKYIKPFGNGHINSTYKIRTFSDVFILQKINHNVFKNPYKLMENIVAVTSFIKEKETKGCKVFSLCRFKIYWWNIIRIWSRKINRYE